MQHGMFFRLFKQKTLAHGSCRLEKLFYGRSKGSGTKNPKKEDELESEDYQDDVYERIRLEKLPLRSC